MTTAYPLAWPVGLPRAKSRKSSPFGAHSIKTADAFVRNEVRLMGGTLPVVSTNLELRNDGLPYANQRQPQDVGVAVYFSRCGKQMVFACDRWLKIEHNLYAIGKTIEALRGIERWGSSDMMEQAFTGFEALSAPEQWWQVLGVPATATKDEIGVAYRAKAKEAHSDAGGSDAVMARLNVARDAALAHLERAQ